ncbi:EAL and HDOD domain-containing protein [Thiohalobacter thiocyanaticus]|uniref:HDOD domain-containing protein n=1 Tax=Thiohalobacter thiocyanaticus TaxID=585455 RepID=A0A426QKC3_9GAMM|nr:HDOD domain-containing protein [Thiohalobacter thiocyanaticus]RRQ22166.1 HDOD domain-containing protein [Thiohalobacter thiocyanaticus]
MQDIFIGRQPIYDRNLNVYAYELLFRSGLENAAMFADGDHATSRVINNAFLEFGLEKLVGRHRAFINLTRAYLTGEWQLPFPRDRVVLEVLEDIEPDAAVIEAVRELRRSGHTLALDDFIYHDKLRPLIEHADIIKIDLMAIPAGELESHLEQLRGYPARLLAEKVETPEQFNQCRALGFDYFQGYFLSRPQVISGQAVPASGLATVRLLAQLQQPEASAAELESLIAREPGLSHKLLRYINSAFFSLPRRVDSIHQALVYLGHRTIKTWATLLVFCGVEDKPDDLMTIAMLRARMCQLLAEKAGGPDPEVCFTAGLFSALEALLGMPLDQILAALSLPDPLKAALLHHEGSIGEALHCVLAYERTRWDEARFRGLAPAEITEAYVEAARWADETTELLLGTTN